MCSTTQAITQTLTQALAQTTQSSVRQYGPWTSSRIGGGQSWTKRPDDSPDGLVQTIGEPTHRVGVMNSPRLVTSTDGGANWMSFHDGLPSSQDTGGGSNDSSFGAISAGPTFLLADSGDITVYRCNTGDAAWTKITVVKYDRPDWTFLDRGISYRFVAGQITNNVKSIVKLK